MINANNPAEILETFSINDRHLLCIASVGGNVTEEVVELSTDNVSAAPVAEGDASQQAEVCAGAVTLVRLLLNLAQYINSDNILIISVR